MMRPRLRGDVRIESGPGGESHSATLVDLALGQKLHLDAAATAVARALGRDDGPGEQSNDVDLVEEIVRFFDTRFLLDTDRSRRLLRELAVHDREAAGADRRRISFLPGTRLGCIGCGDCCRGVDVGPLDPERVRRIRAGLPDAEFLVVRSQRPGASGIYSKSRDDSCAFLEDDGRCRVHAMLGPDLKPTMCRLYPLYFTRTPAGIVGGIRMECRSYLAARRSGGDPVEREAEIRALLEATGPSADVGDLVAIENDLVVAYPVYLELERTLLDTVRIGPPILWQGLRELSATALEAIGALREADRPGRALSVPPPHSPKMGRRRLLESLAEAVGGLESRATKAGLATRTSFTAAVRQALLDLTRGPPPASAPESEDDTLLRDHLAQSIFLKPSARSSHLRLGLALLNLSIVVAVSAAPLTGDLGSALFATLRTFRCGRARDAVEELGDPVGEWFLDRIGEMTGEAP